MQFPFMSPGVPNYVTYAMVGAVVGHEVSHAFDDQGITGVFKTYLHFKTKNQTFFEFSHNLIVAICYFFEPLKLKRAKLLPPSLNMILCSFENLSLTLRFIVFIEYHTGGRYDEYGNLKDWWDAKTANEFAEKTECFVNQYSSVKVDEAGIHLNGRLSVGENIADNAGVKTALKVIFLGLLINFTNIFFFLRKLKCVSMSFKI